MPRPRPTRHEASRGPEEGSGEADKWQTVGAEVPFAGAKGATGEKTPGEGGIQERILAELGQELVPGLGEHKGLGPAIAETIFAAGRAIGDFSRKVGVAFNGDKSGEKSADEMRIDITPTWSGSRLRVNAKVEEPNPDNPDREQSVWVGNTIYYNDELDQIICEQDVTKYDSVKVPSLDGGGYVWGYDNKEVSACVTIYDKDGRQIQKVEDPRVAYDYRSGKIVYRGPASAADLDRMKGIRPVAEESKTEEELELDRKLVDLKTALTLTEGTKERAQWVAVMSRLGLKPSEAELSEYQRELLEDQGLREEYEKREREREEREKFDQELKQASEKVLGSTTGGVAEEIAPLLEEQMRMGKEMQEAEEKRRADLERDITQLKEEMGLN